MTRSRSRFEQRQRARWVAALSLGIAACAAATFPLWSPWAVKTSAECILHLSSRYTVREVVVDGNAAISDSVIIAAAGIAPAAALFRVPLAVIENRVKAHPWLQTVRLRRRLPDTIEIRVAERAAAAILRGDSLRLLTADSVIVYPLPNMRIWDLPLLTPPHSVAEQAGAIPRSAAVLRLLNELMKVRAVSEPAWRNISEIYYRNGEMHATLVDPPVELILGDGASELNWAGVVALLNDKSAVTASYKTIDLSIPGRIIAAGDPIPAEEQRAG